MCVQSIRECSVHRRINMSTLREYLEYIGICYLCHTKVEDEIHFLLESPRLVQYHQQLAQCVNAYCKNYYLFIAFSPCFLLHVFYMFVPVYPSVSLYPQRDHNENKIYPDLYYAIPAIVSLIVELLRPV